MSARDGQGHHVSRVARWGLSVALVGYIVWFLTERPEELSRLRGLETLDVVAITVLHMVYFSIHAYRLRYVIKRCSRRSVPYWQWFRIFMLGGFLNKVIPQAGNIYRGIRLKEEHRVSYSDFTAAFVLFTWFDVWLNVGVAVIGVALLAPYLTLLGVPAIWVLPAVALAVLAAPFLVRAAIAAMSGRIRTAEGIGEKMDAVLAPCRDWRFSLIVVALGVVVFLPMCARIFVVFAALGHDLSVPTVVLFYALLKLSQVVSITPGNLGVQELALGWVAHETGIGMAEGILASALLRVLAYLLLVTFGLASGGWQLVRQGKEWLARKKDLDDQDGHAALARAAEESVD